LKSKNQIEVIYYTNAAQMYEHMNIVLYLWIEAVQFQWNSCKIGGVTLAFGLKMVPDSFNNKGSIAMQSF